MDSSGNDCTIKSLICEPVQVINGRDTPTIQELSRKR
jgi:hypothetical protein